MHTKYPKGLKSDESGFASLVIAIVLIIVLGLLTVGFAELMRHSQQQELNRHLSDQSYYAAESGVNDAVRAINAGFSKAKTECGPVGTDSGDDDTLTGDATASKYLAHNLVDADSDDTTGSPRWTCLLINPDPNSIVYDSVGTVSPKTAIFYPTDTSGAKVPLGSLQISWQDADPTNKCFRGGDNSDCHNTGNGTSHSFPTATNWHAIGMLRVTLTPLSDLTRPGLIKNTFTAFLYPSTDSSNSVSFTTTEANKGVILNGACSTSGTPRFCNATITGVPDTTNGYLISLRSIYSATSAVVTGADNSSNSVSFTGAQTLIDATGKAQNVLKRIQVRVPNRPDYPYPGFSNDSAGGVCKQLSAYPGYSPNMPCD